MFGEFTHIICVWHHIAYRIRPIKKFWFLNFGAETNFSWAKKFNNSIDLALFKLWKWNRIAPSWDWWSFHDPNFSFVYVCDCEPKILSGPFAGWVSRQRDRTPYLSSACREAAETAENRKRKETERTKSRDTRVNKGMKGKKSCFMWFNKKKR